MTLIEFPKTPHLPGSFHRDEDDITATADKILKLTRNTLTLQEKVDGSIIGISYDLKGNPKFQDRRSYIDTNNTIYKKFNDWHRLHDEELEYVCSDKNILFGEWLYWTHSVKYNKLLSFFMVHDIFDIRKGKFISQERVQEKLRDTSLIQNPFIKKDINNVDDIQKMFQFSQFGDSSPEGVYIRVDDNTYNIDRCKFVRTEFQQQIQAHWQSKLLKPNKSINILESNWVYK